MLFEYNNFFKLEKYMETHEESLHAKKNSMYNEDDLIFINNRHNKKKDIIYENHEETSRVLADNFEEYNEILRSDEKKKRLIDGNLNNFSEENEIEYNNSEEKNKESISNNSFEFKKSLSNKEESDDEQIDYIKKKID